MMVILLRLVALLCICLAGTQALSLNIEDPVRMLGVDSVKDWLGSSNLSFLLCIRTEADERSLLNRDFLRAAAKAGTTLSIDGVHFGVFDCVAEKDHDICKKTTEADMLDVYKSGQFLVSVPTGSMFNDASVFSNALQMLLINDVPLLQSEDDLMKYMKRSMDNDVNFLLMVLPAIGIAEHAEYMKAVKSLINPQLTLTFAHSTLTNITSDFLSSADSGVASSAGVADRKAQIYIGKCREAVEVIDMGRVKCPLYMYTGSIDVQSISDMAYLLGYPFSVDSARSLSLPFAVCFHDMNEESVDTAANMFAGLKSSFMGVLGLDLKQRSEADSMSWLTESEKVMIQAEAGSASSCLIQDQKLHLREVVVLESLKEYIIEKIIKTKLEQNVLYQLQTDFMESAEAEVSQLSEIDALIQAVENEDDDIVLKERELGGRDALTIEHSRILNRNDFNSSTKYQGVVLFHLNRYDARSRFITRMFESVAADITSNQLALLDCYDWTDVCERLKVLQYPTIKVFHGGKAYNYTGPYSKEALKRLVTLSNYYSPHKISNMKELLSLRTQLKPHKLSVVIGLFKDDEAKEYEAFKEAAKKVYGQQAMAYATGEFANKLQKQYKLDNLPVIVSYNPDSGSEDHGLTHYTQARFSVQAIEDFALTSSIPAFTELTVELLPLIVKSDKPQFILFIEKEENSIFEVCKRVSAEKSVKNKFRFSYMITEGTERNQRIKSSLSQGSSTESVVVVDYNKAKVYDYELGQHPATDSLSDNLVNWLKLISIGKVSPSMSLGEQKWEPLHPGYDFLSMIDEESKKSKPHQSRLHNPSDLSADRMGEENLPSPAAAVSYNTQDEKTTPEQNLQTETPGQAYPSHTEL